jgi:hypothetical protein
VCDGDAGASTGVCAHGPNQELLHDLVLVAAMSSNPKSGLEGPKRIKYSICCREIDDVVERVGAEAALATRDHGRWRRYEVVRAAIEEDIAS